MKTIKDLTVTCTYTVGLGDVEVENEIFDEFINAYDKGGDVPQNSKLMEWIANNIRESDAYDWSCNIDDLVE